MDKRKLVPGKQVGSMPVLQRKFYRQTLILVITCGIITVLVLYYGSRMKEKKVFSLPRLSLDVTTGQLILNKLPRSQFVPGQEVLRGILGNQWGPAKEGGWSKPWSGCTLEEDSPSMFSLACSDRADLTITHTIHPQKYEDHITKTNCYQVNWTSRSPGFVPMDCFSTEGHHWYGGAEVLNDLWTIEKSYITMQHFLSNDVGLVRDGYGGVMERYWLTSNGITLTVDDNTPLHVGIEEKRICFKATYADPWYQNPMKTLPVLKYTICSSHNVLEAHLFAVKQLFQTSQRPPHVSLFTKPIWSTWAKYRTNITQSKVLDYAKLIKKKGFDGCQIEIDDGYTKHYGDAVYDPDKFPDPLAMSKDLTSLGFKVTTWITPFTNNDSSNYAEGLKSGYFIKSKRGEHLVDWWRGKGAVVDLTNPEAVKWMRKRLKSLQAQGIHAFKFDAGESNFMPCNYSFFKPLVNLNHYGGSYASLMHRFIPNGMIEVRVGYKTQDLPVMVRMMDKDSSWGYHRGLRTVIPTALLFGILGYPYVLPDMVGGNGYAGEVKTLPDKELYLRWLATTVLLPFIQFSIPPWDYDAETVSMAKDLLQIRKRFLKDIYKAANYSAATAYPIIRPLWWIDPDNPETFSIDSEFILGDDLLVAPVLQRGHNKRDIYLPRGKWTDMSGKIYSGKRTLRDYPAALNQLPVFRLKSVLKNIQSRETSEEN